jgi:hypothetical protein
MEYFSKLSEEGELFVTSLSDDTNIIVLSGNYIEIWEIINIPQAGVLEPKTLFSPENYKLISPFFQFLKFNKFTYQLNPNSCHHISEILKKGLSGTYKVFDMDSVSESFVYQVHAKCSPNGTLCCDAYGMPIIECTSNGELE